MGIGEGKRWPSWPGRLLPILAVAGIAVAIWGPPLLAHERATRERFADDVFQHVAPFLEVPGEEGGGARTYIRDYWRACLPMGYQALYGVAGRWTSPRSLSHFLPYGLLGALALALALGGARFGGSLAALALAVAALGSEDFFTHMVGGLPRSFAFPLVAAMAAFAVQGWIGWLMASLVLAFAFYPAVGVAGLLGMGLILLLPAGDRGSAVAWSWRKRALAVGFAGGACLLMVLPNVVALQPYGEGIAPGDFEQYPEAGPHGRLNGVDRANYSMSLVTCVQDYVPRAFLHSKSPWRPALGLEPATGLRRGYLWLAVGMVLVTLPRLLRWSRAGRRLAALTAATAIAYGISCLATPLLFMPERHVSFAVPVLALFWLVAAASALPRIGRKPEGSGDRVAPTRSGGFCALGMVLTGVFLFGGVPEPEQGTVGNPDARLYEFLGTLPEDSFVAGWPKGMSPVPYCSGRSVLISYETHLPYHKTYTDEMRRRMEDLTAAYFATNPAPLAALRSRYGVTHLVVDARHFQYPLPRHFRPFDRETRKAFLAGRETGFEVLEQRSRAAVYDSDDRFVLELEPVQD